MRQPTHTWSHDLGTSYRRSVARAALEAAVVAGSRVLPIWLALLGLGMLLPSRPWLAWALAGAGWAAAAAALIWTARRILKARSTPVVFAAWLEDRAGLGDNELVNALELEARGLPEDPLGRHLVGRVIDRARAIHGGLPLKALLRRSALPKPSAAAAASVLAAGALFLFSPSGFQGSITALTAPASVTAQVVAIEVHPGDVTVDRGQPLEIRAEVSGSSDLEETRLLVRGSDGVWRSHPMTPRDDPSPAGGGATVSRGYGYVLADVQSGLSYLVAAGRHRSLDYRVEVREPLRALGYRKTLDWPSYTRLPRQSEIASHGDLAALPGTHVTLSVTASRAEAGGRLVWSDGNETPLTAGGEKQLEARWVVAASDTYTVRLDDGLGGRWTSEPYVVGLLVDQPPVLRVLQPTGDIPMPQDMVVLLDVECVDDYGLGDLTLVYSRAWEPPRREGLATWEGVREARATRPWDLEGLGLLPGQEITFFFEVTDNDVVSGPKVTRSAVYTIRFPSLAEMYADIEQGREEEIQDLGEMLEHQKELQEDLDEIAREMKREPDLSWEKQQEIQKLLEQQKDLGERLENVSRSLDQSLEKMQEQSLFTPEMMDKLQQIRDLVSEIRTEDFHKYLEAMRQAMESLDRKQLEQAMEQFKFTQEDIRRGLDRTLELLQRLLAEEKLGRLLQEVERLAMEQAALNEKIAETSPPEDGAQSSEGDREEAGRELTESERQALEEEQARLAEETKKLADDLGELEKMGQESLEELAAAMEKMRQENLLQKAQENMEQAKQSMSQGQKKNSLKFGRQAQQSLQAMASSLEQAQADLQNDQNEEITRQLFALSNNLVAVSQTQEDLLSREGKYPTDRLAVEQQALLEETRSSLDSLFAIAKMTPLIGMEQARIMGEAVRKMDDALHDFERGRRGPAVTYARESAGALDQAVRGLLETQNAMCNSSCSNPSQSCMNQMQGLASQQMKLNGQTQQMLGQQSQGNRLTPSDGDQVMRLAARQEMIQKGLESVGEELGNQRNVLGRLDEMAKEMEEIAADMRTRGVDERILRRQEKILSRLLTAQKSIRRQDQKEERVSRPGRNPQDRTSPPPVAPQVTRREEILRGILRGGKDPIPADYRQLVEDYWKALMVQP